MDESLTDLELFRKHCLPILDPWPEAGIDIIVDVFMGCYWMNKYVLDVLSEITVKLLSGNFPPCSGGLRAGRAHVSCEVSGTMQAHEDPSWMGTLPLELEGFVT